MRSRIKAWFRYHSYEVDKEYINETVAWLICTTVGIIGGILLGVVLLESIAYSM